MTRETYICDNRDLHIWQKRPAYVTKETHIHRLSRMATSLPHTPGLILWRPRAKTWKRSCEMAQNRRSCRSLLSWHMQVSCAISHSFVMAYVGLLCHFKSVLSLMQVSFVYHFTRPFWILWNGTRDLHMPWQKRPAWATKQTHTFDKRDLHRRQTWKLSCAIAQETYTCDKRDLHERQNRLRHATKETYICDRRDLHMGQKTRPDQCLAR